MDGPSVASAFKAAIEEKLESDPVHKDVKKYLMKVVEFRLKEEEVSEAGNRMIETQAEEDSEDESQLVDPGASQTLEEEVENNESDSNGSGGEEDSSDK